MIEIVTGLLPMILSFVTWLLNRANASAATKKAYREFLDAIENDAGSSARLRDSAMKQKDRIFHEMDEEKKNGPGNIA